MKFTQIVKVSAIINNNRAVNLCVYGHLFPQLDTIPAKFRCIGHLFDPNPYDSVNGSAGALTVQATRPTPEIGGAGSCARMWTIGSTHRPGLWSRILGSGVSVTSGGFA